MPVFGGSYTETTVSAVHTWSSTVAQDGPYPLGRQGAWQRQRGQGNGSKCPVSAIITVEWS